MALTTVSFRHRIALALRILFTKPEPIPAEAIDGHLPQRNIRELITDPSVVIGKLEDASVTKAAAKEKMGKDQTMHTKELVARPPVPSDGKRFIHPRGGIPDYTPQSKSDFWVDPATEIQFDVGQPVWFDHNIEAAYHIEKFEKSVNIAHLKRGSHECTVYAPRLTDLCRIPLEPVPFDAIGFNAEVGPSLYQCVEAYVREHGLEAKAKNRFQNWKSDFEKSKVQSEKPESEANGHDKPDDVTST